MSSQTPGKYTDPKNYVAAVQKLGDLNAKKKHPNDPKAQTKYKKSFYLTLSINILTGDIKITNSSPILSFKAFQNSGLYSPEQVTVPVFSGDKSKIEVIRQQIEDLAPKTSYSGGRKKRKRSRRKSRRGNKSRKSRRKRRKSRKKRKRRTRRRRRR